MLKYSRPSSGEIDGRKSLPQRCYPPSCALLSISEAPTSKNPPGKHGIPHTQLFIHQARHHLIWIVSDRIYPTILHVPTGIPWFVRGSSEQGMIGWRIWMLPLYRRRSLSI